MAYERERLARIKRNREELARLQIPDSLSALNQFSTVRRAQRRKPPSRRGPNPLIVYNLRTRMPPKKAAVDLLEVPGESKEDRLRRAALTNYPDWDEDALRTVVEVLSAKGVTAQDVLKRRIEQKVSIGILVQCFHCHSS